MTPRHHTSNFKNARLNNILFTWQDKTYITSKIYKNATKETASMARSLIPSLRNAAYYFCVLGKGLPIGPVQL